MKAAAGKTWRAIDERVEAFEVALRGGVAKLSDFLPAPEDPTYEEVLRELVLVDAEWHARRAEVSSVAEYFRRRPLPGGSDLSEPGFRRRLEGLFAGGVGSAALSGGSGAWGGWGLLEGSGVLDGSGVGLVAGQVLGSYRIVREIARGGFAAVYLARQTGLADRPVVLKVSRRSLGEPDKLARLQHTNVVPLFSVHEFCGAARVVHALFGRDHAGGRACGWS